MTGRPPVPDVRPVAVVVDAYSTGAALAPAFAAAGWRTVHVSSSPVVPEPYRASFRPGDFIGLIAHDGDLRRTLNALLPHTPVVVLPGAECGVELADRLAAGLGLPGNGTELSRARRDKFLMGQVVAAAGLAAAPQHVTDNPADAVAWAVARGDWPVVVKPLDSAGTDGVTFCHDAAAVDRAFRALHGRPNRLGSVNDRLLVQGFLRGRQYFVNTVSLNGRHLIAEIWAESKREVADAAFINDLEMLMPRAGAVQDALAAYTSAVLDALGIAWGPAHTELMLTADGPVLIETAARLMGTVEQQAVRRSLGVTQADLAVQAVTDPVGFLSRLDQPYRMAAEIWCVALISEHEGIITGRSGFARIEGLASYASSIAVAGPGVRLRPTIDYFSSPGVVYLVHEDAAVLAADYARIRAWEREGAIFDLAPASGPG
jgi:biotin carboxylase